MYRPPRMSSSRVPHQVDRRCEIVQVYKDHGISGAKGRDKRPAFNSLIRDAAQRKFDMVMAWSVARLGRSLQDLVSFLSELHALRIDLFLHQQGLDTDHAGRQGNVSNRTNSVTLGEKRTLNKP